jgi:hypothetical protein
MIVVWKTREELQQNVGDRTDELAMSLSFFNQKFTSSRKKGSLRRADLVYARVPLPFMSIARRLSFVRAAESSALRHSQSLVR